MFNHHDIIRDSCMLHGPLAHHGYDWWWLLSFMFAIPHWQRRSLSWDNFRRTGLLERSLPTLW